MDGGTSASIATTCEVCGGSSDCHRAVRQQDERLRIRQHVGEPLARMTRIERNISAAGLQHAQHSHDHVERAFEKERYQRRPAPRPVREAVARARRRAG